MVTELDQIREGTCRQGRMIVYRAGDKVPESQLVELGPPAGLGGTVLEGDPRISAGQPACASMEGWPTR